MCKIRVRGLSLDQVCALPLSDLCAWVDGVPASLPEEMRPMGESICAAFRSAGFYRRLIGLPYQQYQQQYRCRCRNDCDVSYTYIHFTLQSACHFLKILSVCRFHQRLCQFEQLLLCDKTAFISYLFYA